MHIAPQHYFVTALATLAILLGCNNRAKPQAEGVEDVVPQPISEPAPEHDEERKVPLTCEALSQPEISMEQLFFVETAGKQQLVVLEMEYPPRGAAYRGCYRATMLDVETGKVVRRQVIDTENSVPKRQEFENLQYFEHQGARYLWLSNRNSIYYLLRVDDLELILSTARDAWARDYPKLEDKIRIASNGMDVWVYTADGFKWFVEPLAKAVTKLPPSEMYPEGHPLAGKNDEKLSVDAEIPCLGTVAFEFKQVQQHPRAGTRFSSIECPRCRLQWPGDPPDAFTKEVFLEPSVAKAYDPECTRKVMGTDIVPKLVLHRKSLKHDADYLLSGLTDDGSVKWKRRYIYNVEGVHLTPELLILNVGDDHLEALDLATGETRWVYPPPRS